MVGVCWTGAWASGVRRAAEEPGGERRAGCARGYIDMDIRACIRAYGADQGLRTYRVAAARNVPWGVLDVGGWALGMRAR